MTTTVTAANAAQFLSFVPQMLGYHPTRSLVLVPFSGSRSIGAMRFDLPGTADLDDLDRFTATLVGMVCRLPDAEAVAAVAYTDAVFAAAGLPHRDLITALERRADACGIRLTDALCVAADGWGSAFDPSCPPSGRALAELGAAPESAAELSVTAGDQATGAELPRVPRDERARTADALASLEDAVRLLCGPDSGARRPGGTASGDGRTDAAASVAGSADQHRVDPRALAAVCTLDDLPTLFEESLGWDPGCLAPFQAAALVWCLGRPALRDIALVQWSGGMAAGDEALDAQLRWEAGEEYPAHLAMQMWGEGERPDPDRLEAALALSRRIAAAAPRAERPGPLATCAWLAWALGRSTHAESYAARACRIEPEHGLAEIVRSFVYAGHLPDWAFRRG
ncbi:DUF4192 domain-containing protein [Microbacterium sp. zg.B48]|uniref:DUF4192 domain-containing protein n=1 Tax=Microbacterium sp. zg.B48 TaxID=2969408 RepID=UPI00214B46A6|nr:DUF4192 domain-containing protein [Microbacterium sp. zg.B48]MCR2764941.1 DUF4192 domain-containing protein [Microbacterium sp. zg.B48]